MAGEKTEKATPKRKQDERKKGNVFFSRDIITALSLLTSFYGIKMIYPSAQKNLQKLIESFFRLLPAQQSLTQADAKRLMIEGMTTFALTALPLLLLCVLVAVAATMLQTRMLFSTKAFAFKGERINPLNGLKKMFAFKSVIELVKSILKITVVGYVIFQAAKKELSLLPRLMEMGFQQSIYYTGQVIFRLVIKVGIIFVFLSLADYLYQWWDYEKNLRMSKQEIKDEYKQSEGDPQIKGRQRSLQQQRSRRRMMQSVPAADVVIRNPTHYAVALKYDQDKNSAPVVVAKGADKLALRIVAIAEENHVYVTENRPLARALFETVEVDQEIPGKYFKAVAEVLAFVYALKEKGER
ncbi:flagellar biosynthesis protein FlhB [Acidaminobacterium chupaoyuni]